MKQVTLEAILAQPPLAFGHKRPRRSIFAERSFRLCGVSMVRGCALLVCAGVAVAVVGLARNVAARTTKLASNQVK